MKLRILILLAAFGITGCRKCVTCTGTVTVETYKYKESNPDSHYDIETTESAYTVDMCDVTAKRAEQITNQHTVVTTSAGSWIYATETNINCNCN